VRQALSLALDREGIVARIGGRSRPATQFVPPGVFGHLPSLSGLAYDPDASRRLLREAGFAKGFDLTLAYAAGAEPVAEAVRAMFQEVGVRVAFEAREWPDLLAAWRAGHAPPFIGSWLFSSGELSMFLKECLFSRDPKAPSGWNPGYSNRRLDELISLNYRTFGEPARLEQSETLMKLLLEEMPLVPLFSREDLYALRSDVKWRPRFDGKLRAADMEWTADH
jgi:peptide/nickel transport system substrate-binding protein